MRKEDLEIIKLTAKEILHTMIDITVVPFSAFDRNYKVRQSVEEYMIERGAERDNLKYKIRYLKVHKLINIYVEGKEKYVEITKKGIKDIAWNRLGKNEAVQKWDGKWRLIIFDIPEGKRSDRNLIRRKLLEIGFIQIQKSVYIYPFDCKREFDTINYFVGSKYYMKYMVAEIIEGEQEIILKFIKNKLLSKDDLKR